ncbi:MAG: hypothetical protein Kow00107_11490 [Planctomycetota bacterium]
MQERFEDAQEQQLQEFLSIAERGEAERVFALFHDRTTPILRRICRAYCRDVPTLDEALNEAYLEL